MQSEFPYGEEGGAEELDPYIIDPTTPTWEAYTEGKAEQARLEVERTELIDDQEKLDAARERVDGGDISEADLAELDAELLETMPASVRAHLAGLELSDVTTELSALSRLPTAHTQSAEASAPAAMLFSKFVGKSSKHEVILIKACNVSGGQSLKLDTLAVVRNDQIAL